MTEEREIIILVIGVLAAAVAFSQRRRIARLPGHRLLWVAGGCWLLGATLTVVETFIPSLEEALNLAEHAAFVAHTGVLVAWAWRRGATREQEGA